MQLVRTRAEQGRFKSKQI